jgi:hypothetical protein
MYTHFLITSYVFQGHVHCNNVVQKDIGFMAGGTGQGGNTCEGQFGITVIDSTNGILRINHFSIQNSTYDNYDELMRCITSNKGISKCYDEHSVEWFNQPYIFTP